MAVNALFGAPLAKDALVPAGLASEAAVSGYHADNIAPALLGGFILIRRGPLLPCMDLHCWHSACYSGCAVFLQQCLIYA